MTPESGEHARLFDISDEEVGAAAAAAEESEQPEGVSDRVLDATVEGADDGRRRRRRSATSTGAFSGRPAALVDDLTLPQRAAVEHRGGPLLIIAGAGSGKTRVLTRRIAHLLATGDAPPWGILAITFTNKAAGEMRTRVADLVGPPAEKMWVSTFHSACLRILRCERRPAGVPLGLHGVRRHRLTPPHRDDHGRAGLRPEAAAVAGGAGGHQPGQVRAGGLRDVRRGRPQRTRPLPQAHRRRVHALSRPPARRERAGLRRPADGDGEPAPGLRRRAGQLPGTFPAHFGRRVPGHEPRPERDREAAGRGPRQRVRGGGLRPVGLPVARRRHPQHPGVRARLPQRDHHHAGAELPLDPDDPRRGQRRDRQQRRAPAQGALHGRRHG